jgi:hypothetical protein
LKSCFVVIKEEKMKYEKTEEFLAGIEVPAKRHDDAGRCGYYNAADGSEDIGVGDDVEFSPCNLSRGCFICGHDTICPRCGDNAGWVNQAGGITYVCCC